MRPLADLVLETLVEVAPAAAARGTTIELDVQDEAGPQVHGERQALSALARNLADNAVRYSPRGARVQVWVGRDAQGAPLLRVDDSGPGIPRDERELVFDRFVRRETGGEESGSGLGLAIVKSVAQRHGAKVSLLDSPLGGLRVEVTFKA